MKYLILILLLVVSNANANEVGLKCNGELSVYFTKPKFVNQPQSVFLLVDMSKSQVEIIGGMIGGLYKVTTIKTTQIFFEGEANINIKTFINGMLNRYTGELTMHSENEIDKTKMDLFFDAECIEGKKLF